MRRYMRRGMTGREKRRLLLFLVLLVLLVVVVLVLILLLVFILLLLVFVLVLVLIVLVAVLLRLVKTLAQGKVVTGLVVSRIVAQTLLICVYRIAIQFMALAHKPYVMINLSLAHSARFYLGSLLKLLYGYRILFLHNKGTTKIVERLWVFRINR